MDICSKHETFEPMSKENTSFARGRATVKIQQGGVVVIKTTEEIRQLFFPIISLLEGYRIKMLDFPRGSTLYMISPYGLLTWKEVEGKIRIPSSLLTFIKTFIAEEKSSWLTVFYYNESNYNLVPITVEEKPEKEKPFDEKTIMENIMRHQERIAVYQKDMMNLQIFSVIEWKRKFSQKQLLCIEGDYLSLRKSIFEGRKKYYTKIVSSFSLTPMRENVGPPFHKYIFIDCQMLSLDFTRPGHVEILMDVIRTEREASYVLLSCPSSVATISLFLENGFIFNSRNPQLNRLFNSKVDAFNKNLENPHAVEIEYVTKSCLESFVKVEEDRNEITFMGEVDPNNNNNNSLDENLLPRVLLYYILNKDIFPSKSE